MAFVALKTNKTITALYKGFLAAATVLTGVGSGSMLAQTLPAFINGAPEGSATSVVLAVAWGVASLASSWCLARAKSNIVRPIAPLEEIEMAIMAGAGAVTVPLLGAISGICYYVKTGDAKSLSLAAAALGLGAMMTAGVVKVGASVEQGRREERLKSMRIGKPALPG